MSTTSPPFSAQLLGQTEKAANAILDRLLAGTGLTEPQWVTLNLAIGAAGTLDNDALAGRVAGVFKTGAGEAQAHIAGLVDAQLLQAPAGAPVQVTDAGQQLYRQVRRATAEITERLWGDVPEADLATAGRVLSTVLARADAELAAA